MKRGIDIIRAMLGERTPWERFQALEALSPRESPTRIFGEQVILFRFDGVWKLDGTRAATPSSKSKE